MSSQPGPGVGPDYLLAGRYRLYGKIGAVGSPVWHAHDRVLDREVAVKQVSTLGRADLVAAATTEGRLTAQLKHPHAITMYDVAIESGKPWLVMEYVPSVSLAQAIDLEERLPAFEVAQIGAQAASALTAAHEVGVVHRDIKPGNILIADRGAALGVTKIADFGIAQVATDASESTDAGLIVGTPAYLAPEIARGAHPSRASDVFALGATLYTAVEGRPPFGTDADDEALLLRVARGQINLPTHAGDFSDVLLRMLHPDPRRRCTMAEARELLAEYVHANSPFPTRIYRDPIRSLNGYVPTWAQRNPVFVPTLTASPAAAVRTPAKRPRRSDKLRKAIARWNSGAAS